MNTTTDLLQGNLDSIADDLATLWQAIDRDGWTCTECDLPEDEHDGDLSHEYSAPEHADHGDPLDALHALPLEIVWEHGEPFAIVLTTGGPHIEITGGGRSAGFTLTGYWSGTTVYRHSDAITATGNYFRELLGTEVAA